MKTTPCEILIEHRESPPAQRSLPNEPSANLPTRQPRNSPLLSWAVVKLAADDFRDSAFLSPPRPSAAPLARLSTAGTSEEEDDDSADTRLRPSALAAAAPSDPFAAPSSPHSHVDGATGGGDTWSSTMAAVVSPITFDTTSAIESTTTPGAQPAATDGGGGGCGGETPSAPPDADAGVAAEAEALSPPEPKNPGSVCEAWAVVMPAAAAAAVALLASCRREEEDGVCGTASGGGGGDNAGSWRGSVAEKPSIESSSSPWCMRL